MDRVAIDDDVDVLVEQPHENVEALVVQKLGQQPGYPPTPHTRSAACAVHVHVLE